MKNFVLIPFPLVGHLVSSVEMARNLTERYEDLTITILMFQPSPDSQINVDYIMNDSINSRVKFVQLNKNNPVNVSALMKSPTWFIIGFMESLMNDVRDEVSRMKERSGVSGFIIDMFCTCMIDVAKEFEVPTYMYFTSGAAVLGLLLRLQKIRDECDRGVANFLKDLEPELSVPAYIHQFPVELIPSPLFEGDVSFLDLFKSFRETKGILVNTFLEFETHAIKSLAGDEEIPPVYPIGPILHGLRGKGQVDNESKKRHDDIISWLDKQPKSSVVFLCFGSNGCFNANQVQEIALALEHSGHRFLWSLRKPPSSGEVVFPTDYGNLEEVLPEGFLQRIVGVGKVIGWAPQIDVLSHCALGGFVSHGGWNSTLESISCGVPMAVWPLGAEQQANAFLMVKELEMAVEIQMDYRKNSVEIVRAEKIENAIKQLMNPGNKIRVKVNSMKHNSEMTLLKGGSSYECLGLMLDVRNSENSIAKMKALTNSGQVATIPMNQPLRSDCPESPVSANADTKENGAMLNQTISTINQSIDTTNPVP